jgi:polyisoprenoid-binding protein YceI
MRAFAFEGAPVRYVIDATASTFVVRAFSSGLLAAFGHDPTIGIQEFYGDAEFDPEAVGSASLRVSIVTSSLQVLDDVSEGDRAEIERRMYYEVLEINRFPEIAYRCSRVSANSGGAGKYWVALNGSLSLHGVSRNHLVSARLTITGDSLRASGEFVLRQRDYEIRPPAIAGGIVSIKDELKFSFDVVARKDGAADEGRRG